MDKYFLEKVMPKERERIWNGQKYHPGKFEQGYNKARQECIEAMVKVRLNKVAVSIRLREYDINTLMAQFKSGELPNSNPVIDAMVKVLSSAFEKNEILEVKDVTS